jgi:hypothetical protein
MKDENPQSPSSHCGLDGQNCKPCIVSRILLIVIAGYVLFHLFIGLT